MDASGDIVLEDMTEAYGEDTHYVVGYWNKGEVDFLYSVRLTLLAPAEGQDPEVFLDSFVTVEEHDTLRAITFSREDVKNAAEALGYTEDQYDVTFTFVPLGGDHMYDYSVTFTD